MLPQMSSEDFFAKLDERLGKQIEEKIKPVRTGLESLQSTVASHNEQIQALQNDMFTMKTGPGSGVSTDAGSATGIPTTRAF
eukprot:6447076-Pyramimonas_sp.AAC.1